MELCAWQALTLQAGWIVLEGPGAELRIGSPSRPAAFPVAIVLGGGTPHEVSTNHRSISHQSDARQSRYGGS